MSLHTLSHQDPPKTSSCTTFVLYSDWDRAATGKNKFLSLSAQGQFGLIQLFATLQTVACQASQLGWGGVGFSRQEYRSI